MRKRIGVLMAQPEEITQNLFIKAFMEEAYAHDYDICIFSMFQKFQQTRLRNIGDSNIFSLIQFDCFEGFVVLLDTLQSAGLEQKIIATLKEKYQGPVIIVDKESSDYDYILMDHYTPMLELINHLIEFHGYKDIAFLGGKEGHPHSLQRYNAFLDAMREHSLPVKENRIAHGNYWYDSGRRFADKLLDDEEGLPEAVACGNDYMAIGLAARLSEAGYKIPEDIAVIGYDAVEEGRTSPVPLTSAKVPAADCGKKCFFRIHHEITGEKMPVLPLNSELILGGSCGCKKYKTEFTKINRDEWKTDHSTVSYYSDFNHLTEDMLCQSQYDKFFEVLAKYSYQIPFKHLRICLNDDFLDPISFIGENARRKGYSSRMNLVVSCDNKNGSQVNTVDFKRSFDTSLMIPDLYEERDYPTTYIFSPLFFEDICFGYAVLNQEEDIYIYEETYRVWIRNINLGIEAFYRQKALYSLIDRIKADQIRDSQTGLYNYQGFYERIKTMLEGQIGSGKTLGIVACDVEDLKGINEKYGRVGGDMAIRSLAIAVLRSVGDAMEACGRLSNDEFLIGFIRDDADARYEEIILNNLCNGLDFRDGAGNVQHAIVHYEMVKSGLDEMPDIDFLINRAVNAKNHKKNQLKQANRTEISEEMRNKCSEVSEILDNELLKYAFQPIVSATDGEIYGYEALMRCKSNNNLTPYDIIKCAENLNRLYDIENLTFNLVLDEVNEKEEIFKDKKIFINSLPAHQLTGKDKTELLKRLEKRRGRIVVEYTEGSELGDEELDKQREEYSELNIEIALDDYGSGYSNVNNLLRYTPRYVKIDRMLINGINTNEQKRHFVKSIIGYARKYDIHVLAEGVETKEELKTVVSIGVDLIQGFYTGRPSENPVLQIDEEIKDQIRRAHYSKTTRLL